jgi:fluoride ion exporter CrcB/FEX
MIDGTATELSPQIEQAFTGYVVGIACCIASFIFGHFLRKCFNPTVPELPAHMPRLSGASGLLAQAPHGQSEGSFDIQRSGADPCSDMCCSSWCTICHIVSLTSIILMFLGYVLGDSLFGIGFYRTMWIAAIFSPFGAFMRWRLSSFNPSSSPPHWFPWGTLFANAIAAVLSVAAEALEFNFSSGTSEGLLWISPVLLAVQVGFAGSLSTVSTMVRELALMTTPGRAFAYYSATVMISMLLGLAIYCPTIRAGQR